MTLPAWDSEATIPRFSVNVAGSLVRKDLGSLVRPTYDLEQLVITRPSVRPRQKIPSLVGLCRARKHMPAYAVAPADQSRKMSFVRVNYGFRRPARAGSTSTLQAQWIDFADGGRVGIDPMLSAFEPSRRSAASNSAFFFFVTRTPVADRRLISTVVPGGALSVGISSSLDLGSGANELNCGAPTSVMPALVSGGGGLTLTSDPTRHD